jgi:hypothetical protein
MAFLLEKEQDERLNKAIEIAHAAGARVILSVAFTYLSRHFGSPERLA